MNRPKFGEPIMSKFRYRSMSLSCDGVRLVTYRVDPTRPASSAPHHAKRMLSRGAVRVLASCSAISSSAAEPVPLSSMPVPSGTESRWAPAITVWLRRPVGESAMRFLGRDVCPDPGRGLQVHRHRALEGEVVELRADREGRADHRAVDVGRVPERGVERVVAVGRAGGALVVD